MPTLAPSRRFAAIGTVLALILVAFLNLLAAPPRVAEAQSIKPTRTASGHFSVTTIAVVVTGTSSLQTRVQAMYLSSETAGNIRFYDGDPSTWYVGLTDMYLIANTPTQVPDSIAQRIFTATAGDSIKCQGPGVLSYVITYTN